MQVALDKKSLTNAYKVHIYIYSWHLEITLKNDIS